MAVLTWDVLPPLAAGIISGEQAVVEALHMSKEMLSSVQVCVLCVWWWWGWGQTAHMGVCALHVSKETLSSVQVGLGQGSVQCTVYGC